MMPTLYFVTLLIWIQSAWICPSSSNSISKGMNFYDTDRPLSFVHIPKVSGTSFNSEVKPDYTEQNCFTAMAKPIFNTSSRTNVDPFTAVMFRHPRLHIESHFFMCYTSSWGLRTTRGTTMPRTGNLTNDFNSWIRHFANLTSLNFGPSVDFNCHDPRDLQTRHMSCINEPNPRANHALSKPPQLHIAIHNLYKADFIGMTDFYHESICLLFLRRRRLMPKGCECNTSKGIEHVHFDHNVKKSNLNFTNDILSKANEMTRLDLILYSLAVERFISDLTFSEIISEKHIGCREYDELRNIFSTF